MPKILITGFPDSGTSFLCNLVSELGFSAGPTHELKRADDHNRWGYWEYRPIYRFIRSILDGPTRFTAEDIPDETGSFPMEPDPAIAVVAIRDSVMVYKDCGIPLFYRLFSPDAKIVVIGRNEVDLLASAGLSYLGYDFTWRALQLAQDKYYDLVSMMSDERDVIGVNYDAFRDDFYKEAQRVCDFLDVPMKNDLHKIFRPRRV